MRTEHRRPLVAFVVVALFCAFTVGNAIQQTLLGNGLGLNILIPMAPPNLVRTIEAGGSNGRYGDTPFLGTAIRAVSDVPAPEPEPATTAPATGGVVVPAVATPTRPTVRRPTARPAAQHHTGTTHHPRSHAIGEPPSPSTGPTTLAAARADLRAARIYANKARQAARATRVDLRWCLREKSRSACANLVGAVRTAQTRADEAAAQVTHLDAVVDHLLDAISSAVAPVREKAVQTFDTRRGRALDKLVQVREQVKAQNDAFRQATREDWTDAVAAYSKALDKAGKTARAASDQRLRQVRAHAQHRQAVVRHIKHVFQQKVRAGHVVAARAYRKRALADLARQDRAFEAKIVAARDRALATYETAVGVAKDALDQARTATAEAKQAHDAQVAATLAAALDTFSAKVEEAREVRVDTIAAAQAEAEATVVVDPATVPVGPAAADSPATPAVPADE